MPRLVFAACAVLFVGAACAPGSAGPTPLRTPAGSPAGATPTVATASIPPGDLPTIAPGGGSFPQYVALCTTAETTLDEVADALESFNDASDTGQLEAILDDVSSDLVFIEDTDMDTARIAGAALTAVTGISLAISEGVEIADQVGPAAAAVRALEDRVC